MSNSKKKTQKPPVALYVAGGVVVLGLIAFLTTRSGDAESDNGSGVQQTADVAVTGTALPQTPGQGAVDTAIGMAMPEISGQDFDGTPVTISNDGRAKAILLLAHW